MEWSPSEPKIWSVQADQGPRTASDLKTAPGLPLPGSQVDMSRDPQLKPPIPTEVLDLIRPGTDTNVSSPKAKDHRAKVTSPVKSPQHRMSPGTHKENAYGRDTKSTGVFTTDSREARKVDVFTVPYTPPKERPSNRTQPPTVRNVNESPQKFVDSHPTAHGPPSTPTSRLRQSSVEIADIVSRIPRTTINSTPQSTPHGSPLSTPRRRTVYVDTSSRLLADTRGEIEWVKGVGVIRANDHHEAEVAQDMNKSTPIIEDQSFPLKNHSTSEHHARAKEIKWISKDDGFEVVLEGDERPVIAAKSVSRVSYNTDRGMFHLAPNKLLSSASFGDVLLEIGGDDSTPFKFRSLVENRFGATKVDKEKPEYFVKREYQFQQSRDAAKEQGSPQATYRYHRERSLSVMSDRPKLSGPNGDRSAVFNKHSAGESPSRREKRAPNARSESPTKVRSRLQSRVHMRSTNSRVITDSSETSEVRRRPALRPGNVDAAGEERKSKSSAPGSDEQRKLPELSIRGGEAPVHSPSWNIDPSGVHRIAKGLPTVSVVIAKEPVTDVKKHRSGSDINQSSSSVNQPTSHGNHPSSVTNQPSSSVNHSSSAPNQPSSGINQLSSGMNQSSSPTSQSSVTSNKRELRYRSDEVVKRNDLVIRIRELSDMVDGTNKFDELDVYDGPFQIIELPLSTTLPVQMFSDESGDDGREGLERASGSKVLDLAEAKDIQDEKLVKLEFPKDPKGVPSKGEPWTKLGRLRPVYRISPSVPVDADARTAYHGSKNADNTRTILNTQHPRGLGDESASQVFGVCRIQKGAYVKVQYVTAESPKPDGKYEVEKLRGKRIWRYDRVGDFAKEKMDDPAIIQYLKRGGFLRAEEVLMVKYLVHWAGWPSEDDTWVQGPGNIPEQFMNAYNANVRVRPDGSTEESDAEGALEVIDATSPRRSKKKRKSVSTQAIAVREEREEAVPSPRRKPPGAGRGGV